LAKATAPRLWQERHQPQEPNPFARHVPDRASFAADARTARFCFLHDDTCPVEVGSTLQASALGAAFGDHPVPQGVEQSDSEIIILIFERRVPSVQQLGRGTGPDCSRSKRRQPAVDSQTAVHVVAMQNDVRLALLGFADRLPMASARHKGFLEARHAVRTQANTHSEASAYSILGRDDSCLAYLDRRLATSVYDYARKPCARRKDWRASSLVSHTSVVSM
jgi:hypothetical protein